jgi:DnaJ family protein A protein 2
MLKTINENLYQVLNIENDSNQNKIKQAFRKLSLQYHPDKDKNPEVRDKYKAILNAYEILIDPVRKEIYDNQINNKTNIVDTENRETENTMINIKNENFNNFIPETINKELEISLEESYKGGMIPVEIEKYNYYWGNVTNERERIYVEINKGIDNNEIIIIKNKGNIYNNIVFGDIKIQIKIKDHLFFKRNGLDLLFYKDISLKESLCGFDFEVKHLNEKKYIIKNDGEYIIKYNEKKIINNLGMERDNYKGNLIIIFNINYPNQLSSYQKTKLKEIL